MSQFAPESIASPAAIAMAADLRGRYGTHAIAGAKAGLSAMSHMRNAAGIELWSEVCAVLATERVIMIRR